MLKKKCSLCGGDLVNNRCTFCGLDNSIYDRERSIRRSISSQSESPPDRDLDYQPQASRGNQRTAPRPEPKTASQKPKTVYPNRQTTYSSAVRTVASGRRRRGLAVWIIIIAVILIAALPALTDIVSNILGNGFSTVTDTFTSDSVSYNMDDTGYDDDYIWDDSDYDPYSFATREIPSSGDAYETVLGNGIYRVGVHIPEGVYRAELVEGTGGIGIDDEENSIYHYVTFGTESEYDQVTEEEDIRLYNGADLSIDSGVILRFTTENAQPLTQEIKENPLSEPVSLEAGTYTSGDGIIPEGIYDITALDTLEDDYGYSSVTLTYPNGSSEYLWVDSTDYAPVSDEYTDTGAKNIVIPAGTEVSVEYGSITLTPSEVYYDVDYTEYT